MQLPALELLSSPHSSLHALSFEEALWLERHGYPTAEEIQSVMEYDRERLSHAVRNAKDKKAAALLGHRLLEEGDVGRALAAFQAGADLGSLYARQQLAIVSVHRVTGLPLDEVANADNGNLSVLIAQLEVTRMLGDHRAGTLVEEYGRNFDWRSHGRGVVRQSAQIMNAYGQYARDTGMPPAGPDPRPNAARWAELQADPDALVTVYRRAHSYP